MLKNITLSAEELLISKAREKASHAHMTLNTLFRNWLRRYINNDNASEKLSNFIKRVDYANPGRKFTREEMNER